MYDDALPAGMTWDDYSDAIELVMRELGIGRWVDYTSSTHPPDLVEVVPLELLHDDWNQVQPPPDEPLLADTSNTRGPVPLPAGFGSLPPGPDLGAALAEVPVRRVSGYDTVEVMTAAYRQSCHAQAVFLAAVLETGMRRPDSAGTVSRVAHPAEFAAEEARAALVWSRRRADSTFSFAWDVHERLPMLGEAMYAGVLDEPRARAFVQWTVGLTDDQAAQIITTLLPTAGGMLVGELIDRIKRAATAIDPGWAERRYQAAVRGRRVEGSRNDDGTANLAGLDLPVDRAAAAGDRIDTLARACKHAGDTRPIHHIRVDLYLGMLDGTLEHLDEDQIITHILTRPFTDSGDGGPSPDIGGGSGPGESGGAGPGGDGGPGGGGSGPTGRGGGDHASTSAARSGHTHITPGRVDGAGTAGGARDRTRAERAPGRDRRLGPRPGRPGPHPHRVDARCAVAVGHLRAPRPPHRLRHHPPPAPRTRQLRTGTTGTAAAKRRPPGRDRGTPTPRRRPPGASSRRR